LAITDEGAESVEAFLEKHEGPFPDTVAVDEFRRSFLAYGVSATPSFILVDAQGKVQSIKTGYRASDGLMIENWTWDERRTTNGDR